MHKSRTRAKELRSVLSDSDLDVRMARLVVLYEDFRIEMYAIAARKIRILDYADEKYRRLYFFRRAIATVLEFKGALTRLNQCPDFCPVKEKFTAVEARQWDEAVTFFENNKDIFKIVRNDVGGHFQEQAALYALQHAGSRTAARMEIVRGSERGAGPIFHFAGEIVATAITAHKGSKSEQNFFEDLVDLLMEALQHATTPMHLVSAYYLWDKF